MDKKQQENVIKEKEKKFFAEERKTRQTVLKRTETLIEEKESSGEGKIGKQVMVEVKRRMKTIGDYLQEKEIDENIIRRKNIGIRHTKQEKK